MSQPSVLAIRNVMQRPSSLPPSKILSFPQNSENSTSSPQAKMTCEPSPNMASETRKPKRLSKRFSQHFPKSRSSDNDGAQEIKRGSTGGFFSNGFSLRTTSYSNSSSTVSSSSSSSTASTTPSTAPSTTPSPRHSNPPIIPKPILKSKSSTTPSTIPQPTITSYNPLENFTPCLHPSCTTHSLPTHLGPTFHLPQPPYNLTRKPALCPHHASQDLKYANADCKQEWEKMRQGAGRKTMGEVARDFDAYLGIVRRIRDEEARALERRLRERVLGVGNRGQGHGERGKAYDWKYTPRPCTRKGCKRELYSPFDAHFYDFYCRSQEFGIRAMETLCPHCAWADVSRLLDDAECKRQEMEASEWEGWIEHVKMDRQQQKHFWEKAQERVVREKGVGFNITEGKRKKNGEKIEIQGKGVDTMREVCVVM